MLRSCSMCGRPSKKSYGRKCQTCYVYTKRGGIVHPLPPKGKVVYANDGDPICHICGRSYPKLMSHVWQIHNIDEHTYKKEFGLYTTHSVMNDSRKAKLATYVKNNQILVKHNLIDSGKGTRFQKGSAGRTVDQVPLQHKNRPRPKKEK